MISPTSYYILYDPNNTAINHIYCVTELQDNQYTRNNIPICNHRENKLTHKTGEVPIDENQLVNIITNILTLKERKRVICGECMEQIFLDRQSQFDNNDIWDFFKIFE